MRFREGSRVVLLRADGTINAHARGVIKRMRLDGNFAFVELDVGRARWVKLDRLADDPLQSSSFKNGNL